jgi:hypothetical protein
MHSVCRLLRLERETIHTLFTYKKSKFLVSDFGPELPQLFRNYHPNICSKNPLSWEVDSHTTWNI